MSDALKRIEEKHHRARYKVVSEGRWFCQVCALPEPCDVVKLARALDEAICYLEDEDYPATVESLKRTLEEVAGE